MISENSFPLRWRPGSRRREQAAQGLDCTSSVCGAGARGGPRAERHRPHLIGLPHGGAQLRPHPVGAGGVWLSHSMGGSGSGDQEVDFYQS